MRHLLLIILILLFSGREAQSDFYKGKQMKIVVGASAGAASDLYARAGRATSCRSKFPASRM